MAQLPEILPCILHIQIAQFAYEGVISIIPLSPMEG